MALAADLPQRTVLLVDDSKFVRATFRSILQASFAVREEADGEAGWQAMETDPSIVMVFSDISMPKLDGFGLLEKIRGSGVERIKNVPFVIISGDEDQSTKRRARDSGANDFIGKTADAPEVLARIDNLLRLVHAKHEAETSREVAEHGAIRDPLTGVFTPHYLVTEARKHFSHSRRHGGPLSVVMVRIDSYPDIVRELGKDIADKLLARIASVITAALRAEDSVGRTAEAGFTVVSASSGPAEALTFARRLREQLESAQVKYQGQPLKIRASLGIASLGPDAVSSVEDLLKLALKRLQPAVAPKDDTSPGMAAAKAPTPIRPTAGLPPEVERAVEVLEHVNAESLGDAGTHEVVHRLLPFLHSALKRLHIDLPAQTILERLKSKKVS